MKVILFRSVDNLGAAGEVVDVKRGYFRNYLEPRGYARSLNKANLALIESRRRKIEAMVAREKQSATSAAEALSGTEVTFQLRANDQGQLFGSVTTMDIAKALHQKGHEADRRKIEVAEVIKTVGEFPARVRLYPEVYADIIVKVERFLRPEEREALEERQEREARAKAIAEATKVENAEAAEVEEAAAEEAEGANPAEESGEVAEAEEAAAAEQPKE